MSKAILSTRQARHAQAFGKMGGIGRVPERLF
jgi:hypothetical protein